MESLKDPCNDRLVKSLTAPPAKCLSEELLYPSGKSNPPDWRVLKDHLFKEGRVLKENLLEMVKKTTKILSQEPNLIRLKDPITVVGDIHGQFYDLVKLLEVGGDPSTVQYLFLGDYVDRGSFSVEVLLLLYALKLNYPKSIWMLRGNHECRQMTAFFNFKDECEYKFDSDVYVAYMESFDALPLCATINGKFIAIHGGISPDARTLSQIHNLNRFQEPPRSGVFCDLLWADPVEEKDGPVSRNDHFAPNEVRGCSYFFSYEAAVEFLDRNGLLSIIRAHEAQIEGYKMHRTNQKTGFPTVITIFSAPNYCDVYNNKGAILKFENNTLNILQFNFSPHPYHLPNFMDVFTWSIPFVSEKVTEMIYYILHPTENMVISPEDDPELSELPISVKAMVSKVPLTEEQASTVHLAAQLQAHIDHKAALVSSGTASPPQLPVARTMSPEKADRLRNKIRAVSRMMLVQKALRQQHESVVKLKGLCPGHRLSPGLLLAGKEAMENEIQKFTNAKKFDLENEKRPDGDPGSPNPRSPAGVSSLPIHKGGGKGLV